ncbi:MAG TPA: helix-turn-helix domain-containing protein, partial [Candidatus Sulfotelmatobacter sp.]|nr:helix-turn-helix domain-containing protein [Candidatus Sulfotelmatobacter sp.]
FLAEEFMRRFSRKHGVHVRGFSAEALSTLGQHSWPGNVRELQNVVERAVILCSDSGVLEPEHLGLTRTEPAAPAPTAAPAPATASTPAGEGAPLSTLAELEKRHILSVLEHCKGNRTHAAKLLDVSIRTLRNKLHEYNNTQPGSDSEEEALVEGS